MWRVFTYSTLVSEIFIRRNFLDGYWNIEYRANFIQFRWMPLFLLPFRLFCCVPLRLFVPFRLFFPMRVQWSFNFRLLFIYFDFHWWHEFQWIYFARNGCNTFAYRFTYDTFIKYGIFRMNLVFLFCLLRILYKI